MIKRHLHLKLQSTSYSGFFFIALQLLPAFKLKLIETILYLTHQLISVFKWSISFSDNFYTHNFYSSQHFKSFVKFFSTLHYIRAPHLSWMTPAASWLKTFPVYISRNSIYLTFPSKMHSAFCILFPYDDLVSSFSNEKDWTAHLSCIAQV